MQDMTPEERRTFLLQGRRTANLASIREDGRPHIAPVWYDLDGDDLIFTTWYTTVKASNLQHNPQVAICIDDDELPYAFVIIEGNAALDPHAADLLFWTTRIAARYMGPELADQFGKRNGVEGEILVRVVPTRIIARTGIAD